MRPRVPGTLWTGKPLLLQKWLHRGRSVVKKKNEGATFGVESKKEEVRVMTISSVRNVCYFGEAITSESSIWTQLPDGIITLSVVYVEVLKGGWRWLLSLFTWREKSDNWEQSQEKLKFPPGFFILQSIYWISVVNFPLFSKHRLKNGDAYSHSIRLPNVGANRPENTVVCGCHADVK